MIILATAATENYLGKIQPYLESINSSSNFDKNIFITLDCTASYPNLSNIECAFLDNSKVINKNPNNCLQHGEFLKCDIFNSFNDNDIICFTDGDIILQRGLTESEREQILSLKDNDVLVQYNAGSQDTLLQEGPRLKQKIQMDHSFSQYPCYNTGVVVCNIKTWKQIESMYDIIYLIAKNMFQHYASQQWVISYIINKCMNPIILDYSFHTHHHHGIVEGNNYRDNCIYHNDDMVLFAHHVANIS